MFDLKNLGIGAEYDKELKNETISLNKLKPNELNCYALCDIEELADDIEDNGLLQDLVVQDNHDGTYTIVVGHRRYEALKLLQSRGNAKAEYVNCKVLPENSDPLMTELKLHTSNTTARQLTAVEMNQAIKRIDEIISQLRDQGRHIKGNTRTLIAKATGLSETQVQKHLNVSRNPELAEKVKTGELTFEKASEETKVAKSKGIKQIAVSSYAKKVNGLVLESVVLKNAKPGQIKHINKVIQELDNYLKENFPDEFVESENSTELEQQIETEHEQE